MSLVRLLVLSSCDLNRFYRDDPGRPTGLPQQTKGKYGKC